MDSMDPIIYYYITSRQLFKFFRHIKNILINGVPMKDTLLRRLTTILASLFLVVICTNENTVLAGEHAGDITKFQGKILIYGAGEVRGEIVTKPDTPLYVRNSVKTKRQSLCYIKFIDSSKIVLKENSSLTIKGIEDANVDSGTVLFNIKKRGQVKGLNISSASITIGVKGTQFAVYKKGEKLTLFLKEGSLELVSAVGEFKRFGENLKEDHEAYEKRLREEFETTKEKMKADFEESKRGMQEGNFRYLKSFEMTAGSAISIDENNEVWNITIPEWVEKDFSLLDDFE